jgi:hypothetical protein
VIDDSQGDQQNQADAETPADQLFFDRQERLGFRLAT